MLLKKIGKGMEAGLLRVRGAVRRFSFRFGRGVDRVWVLVSTLSFMASVGALICLALYGGFERGAVDKELLMRLMRLIRSIFVFTIAYQLVLKTDETVRSGHVVKWIAWGGILLTLIPLAFPSAPHHAALAWLWSRYYFFGALAVYAVAELSFGTMLLLGRRTNPSLILSLSFAVFILLGSLVLMMPRCTRQPLEWVDSFFLASSAVSMTGLSTVDVAATFTPMGYIVLAALMQIGAWGVLTFTSFFALFFSGSTSVYNQLLMRDFIYSRSMSALVPMLLYILGFTATLEAAGAVCLYFALPQDMFADGGSRVLCAVFHSIASFTNSGLSTIPDGPANPMLLSGTPVFYLIMIVMIVGGAIGFPNLVNFKDAAVERLKDLRHRIFGGARGARRVHVYSLNSKIVLATTGILYAMGVVAFLLIEYNHALAGLPFWRKLTMAAFFSATTRSAGFAPLSPASFLNVSIVLMLVLMWIGGASQSMAGGIKVNTFGIAMLNLRSVVRGNSGVAAFGRRIAIPSVRRANSVIAISILTVVAVVTVELLLEPHLPAKAVIFESVSAITTNGLSLGISEQLSPASKVLLSAAMFVGRVGLLSMLMGFAGRSHDMSEHFPPDDVVIN